MAKNSRSVINIGIVGGNHFAKEVLEKTTRSYTPHQMKSQFVAVADPDSESPALSFARDLGMKALSDYHDLYDKKYNIDLIIVLEPQDDIFYDILKNKPDHIRILSFHVFEMFWRAILVEEEKLRERKEEIETIFNGIQDFILVITPDREIIDVNKAFLEQMGYLRGQVIGKKCHEVFQKLDYDQCPNMGMACPLNEVIKNKFPSQQVLTRVDRNGETRYVELTIFPIWEENGKISRFIEISRDITARKKEEEETTRRLEMMVEERTRQLKETHRKLIHQDKMASLGKLSASVVHEINNPIAGILNLIMLIKRIYKERNVSEAEMIQIEKYLELMETETRRISRIVSNLLTFARQSKVEPKSFNLNKIIEKTLILNSNLLKIHGVTVEKLLDPSLPDLIGSEDQLQQVIMNLVSNAAEATEGIKGGSIKIKTEYSLRRNLLTISIKDNGTGIPQEDMPNLFEPFFTTKKKGKGVGLGLSVVYGIVNDHNGTINVESQPGKGTTFKLEFPFNK
ncbi:ATP-binding protein [Thermodesulfobacteriota bacterium]